MVDDFVSLSHILPRHYLSHNLPSHNLSHNLPCHYLSLNQTSHNQPCLSYIVCFENDNWVISSLLHLTSKSNEMVDCETDNDIIDFFIIISVSQLTISQLTIYHHHLFFFNRDYIVIRWINYYLPSWKKKERKR